MYNELIKNYNEYSIHKVFDEDFLTNKSNFDIEYELKDKGDVVGYCKIEYTPFKMEMISELLELKRKELEYLKSQFAEIDRTYTTDETTEKDYQDYLRLKTETDKLEIFLKRDEMEKRLLYLEEQKSIYKNGIDQIDDQEIIETNIVNIDAEISDLNDKLGKYQFLDEDIRNIFINNLNKLKTLKRKEVTYYNKNKNIDYTEIFQYKNEDLATPEETGISKLTDSNGKTIGYRYYRNGINNSFNNNDFVTIAEYPDGQYYPIQGTSNYEDDLEIIHSIFRENYKGKTISDITGNPQKRLGTIAIINQRSKELDLPFIFVKDIGIDHLEGVDSIKIKEEDIERYLKQAKETKKTIVIPIVSGGHRSTMFIEHDGTISLLDTSTVHLKNSKPKESIFGKYTDKIKVLNKKNIQYSGCCCFFSDSLYEVIINSKNNFHSVKSIEEDINNGTLQLKMSLEMGKIFDEYPNLPTIKISKEINNINKDNYFLIERNGIYYGINKDIFSQYGNKFLLFEGLIDYFEKDKEIIDDFKELAKAQKIYFNIENYIFKEIKQRILTLETNKNRDDIIYILNDDGFNYYDEFKKEKVSENKTEKEILESFINKCMEDLKKIEESVIKSLEEKKLIGINKTHDVKEIQKSYDSIKTELKEIFNKKPVCKFILRTPQVEVSKSKTALELPNKYLLKNNMKKIINSNLLNHSTTFAEKEIIRKQQKKYTKEKIIHNITH